jgi:hypothetical protein
MGILTTSPRFAPTGGAWSPLDLPDLVRWLDAEDSTFDLTGTEVDRWYDLSGNGWDVQQTTTALKPDRLTATLNGKAVVDFNPDNRLTTVSWTTISQPCTICIVFQPNLGFTTQAPHQSSGSGTSISQTGANAIEVWGGSAGTTFGGVSAGTPYVLTSVQDGASSVQRLNGTVESTATVSGAGVDGHKLGGASFSDTTWSFDGYIAAHIVCSSALGTSDLDLLDDYMIARWGL